MTNDLDNILENTVGDRIRKLRKSYNFTIQELANKVKVAKSSVSQWENNKYKPRDSTIQSLAQTFNVEYEYLLSGKEQSKTENYDPINRINGLERTVLHEKLDGILDSQNQEANIKIRAYIDALTPLDYKKQ